jgi:hypothetical protein
VEAIGAPTADRQAGASGRLRMQTPSGKRGTAERCWLTCESCRATELLSRSSRLPMSSIFRPITCRGVFVS